MRPAGAADALSAGPVRNSAVRSDAAARGAMMRKGLVELLRDRKVLAAYGFIAAPVIIVTVFGWIPSASTIALSFFDYDIVNPPAYAGLANWVRFFDDPKALVSLANTVVFMLGHVPAIVVCGLAIALVLNEKWVPGRIAMRTMYFLPLVLSMIAVGVVWLWLLNPAYGIANRVTEVLGLGKKNWLGDPKLAMSTVIFISIWKNVGFYLVLFLAGLQAIPDMYYESARIDGSNRWQEFWHITLPMLKSTLTFATIMGVIGSFQVFEQIYVMTEGGPVDATRVIVYHLWWTAFQRMRMGYASAMAVIIFAVVLFLTLAQLRLYGKEVEV